MDIDKVKAGIRLALPLLKLLAARTANPFDDQLVAFLELVLAADDAKVKMLTEGV